MKNKYIINNKTYTTKAQILKYFKNIKDKYPVNTLLKETNEEDYNDVIGLFKYHSAFDKKTKDMKDIIIKQDYYKNKAYFILKNDNTTEDISYIHAKDCVGKETSEQKAMTIKKNLNSAFRFSVQPQIKDFRKKTNQNCCQFCESVSNLEVDHILEFKTIVEMFKSKNKLKLPTSFNDNKKTNQAIFKEEDKNLSDDFYNFHLEKATLRLLCKKCNLGRTKKFSN